MLKKDFFISFHEVIHKLHKCDVTVMMYYWGKSTIYT